MKYLKNYILRLSIGTNRIFWDITNFNETDFTTGNRLILKLGQLEIDHLEGIEKFE
jgi:hypothetical protein